MKPLLTSFEFEICGAAASATCGTLWLLCAGITGSIGSVVGAAASAAHDSVGKLLTGLPKEKAQAFNNYLMRSVSDGRLAKRIVAGLKQDFWTDLKTINLVRPGTWS